MSQDLSPRLSLPLLAAGQAQKEMTHNEALQALDALVQPVVLSADRTAPPTEPAPGACWIVAVGAAGAWAGQDGTIAQWTAGGWRFSAPSDGWRCHVIDRSAGMVWGEGGWQDDLVRTDGIYLGGHRVIGPRSAAIAAPAGGATIDSSARLVINEILAMLRDHGLISS
ncbi:DUF2793 domain-containing protein [Sphingobium sufflavum]|uniref:DUF2793 domain-containing protein n=1 Tax=Sphingobium sufflavum TaxID=1129547 RepID=UPI001F1F728E|nr:DUF2793 domain-containing protein [Sphingobium sufflavum]MCE7798640.1 DUF2793 domain-containing protein [Sphingobium sufflavum]